MDTMTREEARAQRAVEAAEADARRSQRSKAKGDIVSRVQKAAKRMKGANASSTIQLIDQVSLYDRDAFLIAEEFGPGRKSVLRSFNTPKREVRDAYLQAAGESPNETLEAETPTVGQTEE